MTQTVKAWTRQDRRIMDDIERLGRYTAKREYIREKNMEIADYYLDLYDWYTRKAQGIVERPADAEYPIWLFLDKASRLPPIEGTVCLELDVPRELIVFTDVERWGYRVNYMYIPLNDADARTHEEELKRNGIMNETALIQTSKGNFYPLLKQKIIKSWNRVFADVSTGSGLCQGTIWEIRKEWISGIEYGG